MNAAVQDPTPSAAPTPNLRTAFAGVWRLTAPKFLTPRSLLSTAGAIAALGAAAYASNYHQPEHLLTWVLNSYLSFLVPLIAFVAGAGALRDDMKASTTDYVLTRAIPRPAFVGFKFIAQLAGTELQFLAALVVLIAIGAALGAPGSVAWPTFFVVQVFLVLAFAGLGFLCASLTSRYVVVGLIYGAVVEVGVGQIPTQLNRISMSHQARALIEPLTENVAATPTFSAISSTCFTLTVFAAVTVALAAVVFSLREFAGHAEA